MIYPMKLRPATKDYVWGGKRLKSGWNKPAEGDVIAESWELSCHNDGMSVIENGEYAGMPLGEMLAHMPIYKGKACEQFEFFPILIKLIDASSDLSVQVHPSDEYALANEGQYGKSEMWYVVEANEGAGVYCGFKKEIDKEQLKNALYAGEILPLLMEHQARLGVGIYTEEEKSVLHRTAAQNRIIMEPLLSDRMRVYLPKHHPLAFEPQVRMSQLEEDSAILLRNTPKERGLYPDNVDEAEFRANYSAAPPEMDNIGWTTGKLLRTKETWLCVLSTGLLMLIQMGIMTQLVARNMEVGMNQAMATGVMSAIAVIGIIGSVIIGGIVFKMGIKKAGVMVCILYIVALLCNISGVMPLVWVSLIIIGFLGAAAPNLMNSIPGSVFGRLGYAKVNSVVFPITSMIYMCNFAVNGVVQKAFGSISAVYIVFAVMALVSMLLILAIQDHKYDQDYMAAHKN